MLLLLIISRLEKVSASIKQYEHRIEQVAALKTHIINYAKTHDTYVAYRKASPREKAAFRSAHEADLLLAYCILLIANSPRYIALI